MKVNEVRFNNWVNFKFKGVDYGNVMIDKNYFSHYENKDYEYTPISLTEEWKIKLGFKNLGNWELPIKNGFSSLIEVNGVWFLHVNNKINITLFIDLDYVHQIQNLYFELTRKELIL